MSNEVIFCHVLYTAEMLILTSKHTWECYTNKDGHQIQQKVWVIFVYSWVRPFTWGARNRHVSNDNYLILLLVHVCNLFNMTVWWCIYENIHDICDCHDLLLLGIMMSNTKSIERDTVCCYQYIPPKNIIAEWRIQLNHITRRIFSRFSFVELFLTTSYL